MFRYFLRRSRAGREIGIAPSAPPAAPRGGRTSTPNPCSMALTPRATARWVLPTPGGPWISRVRFSRIHWTGGQRLDAAALDRGLESEVEVGQGLARWAGRELQRGAMRRSSRGEFDVEQPVEEPVGRASAA